MVAVALAGGTPPPPTDGPGAIRLLQRPDLGLFAVAQGVGPSAAAAELAVQMVDASVGVSPVTSWADLTSESSQGLLTAAIHDLQVAWTIKVEKDAKIRGIGATIVAALRISRGVAVAHLGDCGALLLRQGTIVRRTLNHSLTRDYRDASGSDPLGGKLDHVIVRAVGMTGEPEVQCWDVAPGDLIVLSAGVHDLLSDAEFKALTCSDPPELAKRLVKAAGSHAPHNDIAALVFPAEA